MKILARLLNSLQKFRNWYRDPIPGAYIMRLDPVTVLAIIALIGTATTFWGMGRGIGVEKVSVELAQQLRNAPAQLTQNINAAYEARRITGYDREVALQKVNELARVYNTAADIIQQKGQDASFEAAANSLVETLMNYNPGGRAGSFFGATSNVAQTGRGLDMLFTLNSIANSFDEFELFSTPFSAEEALLAQQIKDVLGQDSDALFAARVRGLILSIRKYYIDELMDDPCNPDQVAADVRDVLVQSKFGSYMTVYGPGEKWPTYEAFLDWLISQARMQLNSTDSGKNRITANGYNINPYTDTIVLANTMTLSFPLLGGDVSGDAHLEFQISSGSCGYNNYRQNLNLTGTYDMASGFSGQATLTASGEIFDSNCKITPISTTEPNFTWTGQLEPSNGQCTVTGRIVGPVSENEFWLILE
jgi:hypothetical protein